MTIERVHGFSESRRNGVGLLKAVLGERTVSEVKPRQSFSREIRVIDDDTIEVFEGGYTGSQTSLPIYGFVILSKEKVNKFARISHEPIMWEPSQGKHYSDTSGIAKRHSGPVLEPNSKVF